jgi:anti-sigma regulatory factor (Ser/Thr protein kinase)
VTDEIRLLIPAEESFHQVARLVVGGLGARLDLTYENLDDIDLLLETLLGARDDEGEIEIVVKIDDGALCARVGPYPAEALAELDGDSTELGLRRVLETVSDTFHVEKRDGGSWVEVRKQIATPAGA